MWPYHPDLLARPVPRYTSFPTAVEFSDAVAAPDQAEALAKVAQPASLYLHIPYCDQICWYCGCNTGVAGKTHRLASYLDAIAAEIDLVAAMMPATDGIARIAFGGGSPNAIAPLAFVRLLDHVMTRLGAGGAQVSVELDPRSMTQEWGQVLGASRVTHASMGVQIFSHSIQQRIGRIQPVQLIADSTLQLREAGVGSINFDLMYGLPGQTMDDLDDTLAATIAIAPERIALFGYAHVPHLLPRQRKIDTANLPDQAARFAMAAAGYAQLTAAGYVPVGFDHFALPHDGLAIAARSGTLRRNFQGFTDDSAVQLIGLGASAISCFTDRIIQNEKNAGRYRMRLSQGHLAGARGVLRNSLDRNRAIIIEDILCLRPTDIGSVMDDGCLLAQLEAFISRGLIARHNGLLSPTPMTVPYARAIAALFDPYRSTTVAQFSSAV